MSAAEALKAARAAGIRIGIDGGDLTLEASAAPPPAVLDLLSRHKTGIVAPLRPANDRAEYGRVLAAGPLPDMPPRRWEQFKVDAELFLDNWAEQALAIGWTVDDIFGHDARAPWHRIDKLGLVWLLGGDRVVAMDERAAHLVNPRGTRLKFYRLTPARDVHEHC